MFTYISSRQRKFIMVFSREDRISIQNLYEFKGHGAKRLIKEFSQKGFYRKSVKDVQLKLRLTEAWSSIQQSVIDQAIDQWRTCLLHVSKPKENTLNTRYDV